MREQVPCLGMCPAGLPPSHPQDAAKDRKPPEVSFEPICWIHSQATLFLSSFLSLDTLQFTSLYPSPENWDTERPSDLLKVTGKFTIKVIWKPEPPDSQSRACSNKSCFLAFRCSCWSCPKGTFWRQRDLDLRWREWPLVPPDYLPQRMKAGWAEVVGRVTEEGKTG